MDCLTNDFEVSSSVGIGLKVFYNAFLSLIECNTYRKTLHSRLGRVNEEVRNIHDSSN